MLFQFLIGRLETHRLDVKLGQVLAFQFLIGRLETRRNFRSGSRITGVSIPHR